jgi:hypothetical protein
MPPITRDTLFYGDNLDILREYLDTARRPRRCTISSSARTTAPCAC